jgi:hypothetical protein
LRALLYYCLGARPAFHCLNRPDPRESSCVPAVKVCANQAMEENKDKDNTAQKIPSSSKKEGHSEDSEEQELRWTAPSGVAQRTIAYRSRPLIRAWSFSLSFAPQGLFELRLSKPIACRPYGMPFIVSSLRSHCGQRGTATVHSLPASMKNVAFVYSTSVLHFRQ